MFGSVAGLSLVMKAKIVFLGAVPYGELQFFAVMSL